MNRGTAKVIVNEVTSGRPTALNGLMEVAGGAASVVVANPDGIRVNGGRFINTSRAVLTRAAEINAGIWAKEAVPS